MRPAALALLALALSPAAQAQQYWLPNGPGGTTYNNPQGSLTGTMNEHLLQRHMQQRQWERQRASGGSYVPPVSALADPSFRLGNTSGQTMREVYVSAANDNGWGPDRLGSQVLQPGQRLVVRLPAGQCVNDVRIVFANGQAMERRRVDTCAITDLNLP
jgi:hypothetical protein